MSGTRNVQIPSNLINELGVPQIIDITDELPKLRGGGWDSLNPSRQLEALTDVVWHHTAEFVADDVAPETHANNHIRAGEGGMPYHFYIKNGQIYQCNDILTFTYGVSSNNTYTVHCSVEGCYAPSKGRPADELSDANLKAMIALDLTLRGILPKYRQSRGHGYYRPNLCPGYSMTRFLESVADVQNRIAFNESEQGLEQRAFSMANVVLYYYNLAKGKDEYGKPVEDGTRRWARQRLLLLEPAMREHGFVK